eukprot:scaffold5951_cov63-Phaeocystis_antarctica.AAC.4
MGGAGHDAGRICAAGVSSQGPRPAMRLLCTALRTLPGTRFRHDEFPVHPYLSICFHRRSLPEVRAAMRTTRFPSRAPAWSAADPNSFFLLGLAVSYAPRAVGCAQVVLGHACNLALASLAVADSNGGEGGGIGSADGEGGEGGGIGSADGEGGEGGGIG